MIVWVHGDCLTPTNPALLAHPGAPALYVWDDDLLATSAVSLKRIMFMYECLLEMPVAIRRGDVAEQIVAFAREHNAGRVITTESVSPRFRTIAARIKSAVPLTIMPVEPFLDYDGFIDLKRFSRYWSVAQKHVFD
jgi:hypothetical protein